jgi:hypothetical protein
MHKQVKIDETFGEKTKRVRDEKWVIDVVKT